MTAAEALLLVSTVRARRLTDERRGELLGPIIDAASAGAISCGVGVMTEDEACWLEALGYNLTMIPGHCRIHWGPR